MKEELRTQVACYIDHLLKSTRENKGKEEQLEFNYKLIKQYIYIYTHTADRIMNESFFLWCQGSTVRNKHSSVQKSE